MAETETNFVHPNVCAGGHIRFFSATWAGPSEERNLTLLWVILDQCRTQRVLAGDARHGHHKISYTEGS